MTIKVNRRGLADAAVITLGAALYAAALSVFITPNHISPGGITGVAAILNYLIGIPTGTATLLLNIPLLIWGIKRLGAKFLYKTIGATVVLSVCLDLFDVILPAYSENRLLATLYGGAVGGFGMALVFLRGGTTGGSDIAAKIITLKHPFITIGRMVLILDTAVILAAALTYRNVETALYTTIMIFVSSRVIDSMIYGADKGKLAFIISANPNELASAIMKAVNRGVTILRGKGAFSGSDKDVIICAVRLNEAAKLHSVVKEVDPSAFMVISEAGEIVGEGFKKI